MLKMQKKTKKKHTQRNDDGRRMMKDGEQLQTVTGTVVTEMN